MKSSQNLSFRVLVFLFSFAAANIFAQDYSHSLSSADVKQFVDEFQGIKKDFKALELDFEADADGLSLPEGAEYLEKINSVVKKHGYADYTDFAAKAGAIMLAYSALAVDNESSGVQPQIAAAIEEVENNENYTAEQKAQMIESLKASAQALEDYGGSLSSKENIEAIKPFYEEIQKITEED